MTLDTLAGVSGAHLDLSAESEAASRAIPPMWPLASSVAVNPFLGQADRTLPEVSALMGRVAGRAVTMPPAWYHGLIKDGTITDADLNAAAQGAPVDVAALRAWAASRDAGATALPTVAHLAAEASGIDWPGIIADRIGAWAAGYFDAGQALWQVTPGPDAFENWQTFAQHDLTPEIAGLTGFASTVAAVPRRSRAALSLACDALGVEPEAANTYFHQLLLGLGGWSQLARHRQWQAEMAGGSDTITTDLLTIRLIWEQALLAKYGTQIAPRWAKVRAVHAIPPVATEAQIAACALQEAAERASQRDLAALLNTPVAQAAQGRPALQAAFCIDVRSEVYRRALEGLDPAIQTLGFAGFFGLGLSHSDFASDVAEARLPVLLSPALHSSSAGPGNWQADQSARLSARASRAWGRFKLAAVSSFAFVEATGPVYVAKLLRDAVGHPHKPTQAAPQPRFDDGFATPDRIKAAGAILRAMSLSDGFAPVVALIGHGASVVNNPHASALQCGACGGHAGDVNARLLAGLLNDPKVRSGLAEDGIVVPADTVFVAGLHDTTTDTVTLFEDGSARAPDQIQNWLAAASALARTERALRLPRAAEGGAVIARSTDWAETRPEWALAGCRAFIAAPRSCTRGRLLGGRAFLHDYDWEQDEGFKILELILTAPVVVASWISLQYYGSVVMPEVFGAGNKLLHNVTGGIGVIEGNGGTLRSGLPWQSVHDGTDLAHAPLRLSVCIKAPPEAVSDILARHPGVRALFDNCWMHLFVLDADGRLAQRYAGDLTWEGC
jgi:hypothetical protein